MGPTDFGSLNTLKGMYSKAKVSDVKKGLSQQFCEAVDLHGGYEHVMKQEKSKVRRVPIDLTLLSRNI